MKETTTADRKKELRSLLDQVKAHPERDHTKDLERIAVLKKLVGA